MTIDSVISVACARDVDVWRFTSPRILRHIRARRYVLIVPPTDVELFNRISPSGVCVASEDDYLGGLSLAYIQSRMPAAMAQRAGWYLQQFVKIQAAREGGDIVNLVWDADTAPLRQLDFVDRNGRIIYYKSKEYHLPYFTTMQKLLGMPRGVGFSFIAQCFPVRASWVNEMIDEIEKRSGVGWIDAVLDAIDHSSGSGFSEYETMGNYARHHHESELAFTDRRWLRLGNSKMGGVQALTTWRAWLYALRYDYVAFEGWDPVVKKSF